MKTQLPAVISTNSKNRTALISPKALLISIASTGAVLSGTAQAALDEAQVTAIQTEVLADVTTAVGAGFAVGGTGVGSSPAQALATTRSATIISDSVPVFRNLNDMLLLLNLLYFQSFKCNPIQEQCQYISGTL